MEKLMLPAQTAKENRRFQEMEIRQRDREARKKREKRGIYIDSWVLWMKNRREKVE